MSKITETVMALAKPVVEAEGCELWDVEYVKEAGAWYLRVERELKRPGDFEKFKGSQVEVRHYQPVEGAKSHIGTLRGYADGAVTIEMNGQEKTYQKAQVAQVRLSVTI